MTADGIPEITLSETPSLLELRQAQAHNYALIQQVKGFLSRYRLEYTLLFQKQEGLTALADRIAQWERKLESLEKRDGELESDLKQAAATAFKANPDQKQTMLDGYLTVTINRNRVKRGSYKEAKAMEFVANLLAQEGGMVWLPVLMKVDRTALKKLAENPDALAGKTGKGVTIPEEVMQLQTNYGGRVNDKDTNLLSYYTPDMELLPNIAESEFEQYGNDPLADLLEPEDTEEDIAALQSFMQRRRRMRDMLDGEEPDVESTPF